MLKRKITAVALAGVLAVSGIGVSALAAETSSSLTVQDFIAGGKTLEGLKNAKTNLDEKGITLEEAKANFSGKIEEYAAKKGITVEEAQAQLAAFKDSGKTVDGLSSIKAELDAKGVTLEEAKANFEVKFGEFAAAGGMTTEEAKAKMAEIKASGKTLEGLKNLQDKIGNIPVQ